MSQGLFDSDPSEAPVEALEEVGDRIEVWSRQFVNRWVFLPDQRQAALRELGELIEAAKIRT